MDWRGEVDEAYFARMREMLGDSFGAYMDSCMDEPCRAIRLNPQKASESDFLEKSPFTLSRVPWARDGFYYGQMDAPGRHPYHEAGVYYVQEPSAMAPAEYLVPKPSHGEREAAPCADGTSTDGTSEGGASADGGKGLGANGIYADGVDAAPSSRASWDGERVLDLCAAPGGKSTQIAAHMAGRGLLVCNEVNPARAKVLSGNIERMGVSNAIVTCEEPGRLAERFPSYFTKILVDAPCSGEGMFRKSAEARAGWHPGLPISCARRQGEILDCAARMLAAGGRMAYSTCTFSPEEDEGAAAAFLRRHPEFSLAKIPLFPGMEAARIDWAGGGEAGAPGAARFWPHRIRGEGHFVAVFEKEGEPPGAGREGRPVPEERGISLSSARGRAALSEYLDFAEEALRGGEMAVRDEAGGDGRYLRLGDQLWLLPSPAPSLGGIRVLRRGLHLGTFQKNRFEPSHALALFLSPKKARRVADFSSNGGQIRGYFAGEALPAEGERGWTLVSVDDYSAGWAKASGGVLKNHYPKGLRRALPPHSAPNCP